jgi:hypothetical protein
LKRAGADDDPMAKNAYIDSAHLHARVLVDFLLGSGRGSDVLRTGFEPEWVPKPTEAAQRLNDNNRRLVGPGIPTCDREAHADPDTRH